ncbi:hypothetical protein EDD18DRAFT_1100611 [Armillaria luteobubalina]|uniref:Transcription factor domain-containing protein n=1 Tax=Armillaria luteobubalina TaxID=153913 RepID=A0AA39QGY5_9AGAR|nr:hypothetical protein EDD18DRAFT_1100611 [Armillaria luteobubalina]
MHFAKHLAANALVQGEMKSIKLCQAYILMSLYAIPQSSWESDQSWLYTGLSISIPWMMKQDPIIHHPGEWYRQSQYNLDYDVYLCGYNDLVCIVVGFFQDVLSDGNGLINSERRNLWDVTMRYDVEIEIFGEEWKRKLTAVGIYHGAMLICSQLYFFHQAFHIGSPAAFPSKRCLEYTKSVIKCMNEDMVPSGFMRYSPDSHFTCAAFTVVFLFKAYKSIQLIEILINKFSSSDIAVDDQHTPKVYARFLAMVLDKYQHSVKGAAFEGSQRVIPGNVGESRSVTGETSKESGDNCWPTQFGTDAEQLHIMSGNQNINGNDWAEAPPRNIEDQMFASMSQSFENHKWLQGFLMPG